MKKVFADLRPDKCHVIFEKIADDMFLATQDPCYDLKRIVSKQARHLVNDGFSVVLCKGKDLPKIMPRKGKVARDVYNEFIELERKANGNLRN
jgi:hypothetical protein